MVQNMMNTIDHIECTMTKTTKQNIITNYRKLSMFGKKTPFIPHFDEFFNELPTTLEVYGGMKVKLVDDEEFGEYYLELKAILSDDISRFVDIIDKSHVELDDLPF